MQVKHKCLKIFVTGENVKPDFRDCDYAFSFEPTDERNFQWPVYVDDSGGRFDAVIRRVIEIDNDDDLYRQYVNAPAIVEGFKAYALTEELLMRRLDEIVDSIGVVTPVSLTWTYRWRGLCIRLYGWQLRMHYKFRIRTRIKRLLSFGSRALIGQV